MQEKKYNDDISALRADHQKHVMSVMTTGAQSLIEAKNTVTETYEKLLSQEREKCSCLSRELQEATERIGALETEMPLAVHEAKKKVYEKAQAQFAAGNKEFLKIKNALKDAVTAKEEAEKKITSLETSLRNAVTQQSAASVETDRIKQDMLSLNSRLEQIVKADVSVLSLQNLSGVESVEYVLRYYREKNGEYAQQLSKTNEERAQQEAIATTLKEKMTTAENTIKSLTESLTAAECKIASSNDSLSSAKRENQSQLLLVANLMSEKGRFESELISTKKELESALHMQSELATQLVEANGKIAELTNRCEELRAMNKDAIEMLEAMYAKEREYNNSFTYTLRFNRVFVQQSNAIE